MADLADFMRQHFEFYQQPRSWYRKAVSLRASAAILYDSAQDGLDKYDVALQEAQEKLYSSPGDVVEIDTDPPDLLPFYLLSGYAVENIFKAVMVHRDPSLINASRLRKDITKHKLCELAKTAKIDTSAREEAVLRWLEQVVIWKGRYEAPREQVQLGTFWAFDHTDRSMREMCNRHIDNVFDRAVALLPEDVTAPFTGKGVLVAIGE